MTLDQLHDALLNWGQWSARGGPILDPDLGYACDITPLFEQWLPSQWWKDNGEDAPAGVEVLDPVADEFAAYALEKVINGLQGRHKRWLVQRYVEHHYVDPVMLGAAQRALLYRLEGE